ncbi:MAG: glycoside hydrolase family 5 protein [Flavisolibacter sp.]
MHNPLDRRRFIKLGMVSSAFIKHPFSLFSLNKSDPTYRHLPRWRGFNLLEKFDGKRNQPFVLTDFQWMHDWGFDFVRLPMSYHCWSSPADWMRMDENILKEIDQAIEFGQKYKIHVNLNLHRVPGYCVNPPAEPLDLWKDSKALDAAAFQWQQFAKRYRGTSNSKVSFDLINEPANVSEADYTRVINHICQAIRAEDSNRLIIADGLQYGTIPVPSLINTKIAQSTRGYGPFQLTHYKAPWVKGSDAWPEPQWPYSKNGSDVWDKNRLIKETYSSWKDLNSKKVGVHVGEWGAYNHTPHDVVLSWMKDILAIWKDAGWGWSLWNFRGAFGILDSNRADVTYEDFNGHKLDRKMLQLLQSN